MNPGSPLVRRVAVSLAVVVCLLSPVARAQGPLPVPDRHVTYILPLWINYLQVTDAEFAAEVQQLRARIGEGPRARVGFTTYIPIDMTDWNVDAADASAVRAALAGTIARMDAAIARSRALPVPIPICLSFLTAIRSSYDGAQRDSEIEDRRNMQWYSNNGLASGWWSLSQYARKQRRVQEAYMRELGRILASRMAANPGILVAASGDAEVELSFDSSAIVNATLTAETSLLADYSPFAVAEFRDWLRQAGQYAGGGPLAGHAWSLSARYAGDASPALDSNGDGHTLNADFGTSFDSWDLRHFDWSLGDPIDGDPHAISASQSSSGAWSPLPAGMPGGFDPPRVRSLTDPWWMLWDQFRQTMVHRHNVDVARWMTTSADPGTGATVPAERWYSDQIPADYLFGHTPQNRDFRLDTSASPWWTADVAPYGSLGITAFNTSQGNGNFARTLAGVGPQIAATRQRWGLLEWNPSAPATSAPGIYEEEMALVEKYRPSLLVPAAWGDPGLQIQDTPFETALRGLVQRIGVIPLTLSHSVLSFAAIRGTPASRTPAQIVRVSGLPGELPPWSIDFASSFLSVEVQPDGRTLSVGIAATAPAAGSYTGTVIVSSSDPGYSPAILTVVVEVKLPGTSRPPVGLIDTPLDGAVVTGEVGVTGWAVDDVGVSAVEIYRRPLAGEPTQSNGLVFVGTATALDGARPDVEGGFPAFPIAYRAGWGFMVLTNLLPNQGNGRFTLVAFARDYDGHSTELGQRTIDCRNGGATRPFGTIDTPRQGETVSGTIVNFGWALAPIGAAMPVDGSSITVYIDGVPVGHPDYNHFREDIASLFPGYANANGAIGFFTLDTTTLSNGVHTIEWGIVDSLGRGNGAGSRYFTVANP